MKLIKNYREYGALCSFSKTFKASATNSAFTLAEMMVVMLILSIIMAAMAPVMTTRNKTDYSSPWKYTTQNPSNAYFGAGTAQIALIGQANAVEGDDIAKLVINTSDRSHIALKSGNSILARLHADNNSNLFFSNIANTNIGSRNTGIGVGALHAITTTAGNIPINNTAIGAGALAVSTTGSGNTAIGTGTLANSTTGTFNTAIGVGALGSALSPDNSTVIGYNAASSGSHRITVIGSEAGGSGSDNVAIGYRALDGGSVSNNIAIGIEAMRDSYKKNDDENSGENNIAIGYQALKDNTGAFNVVIGNSAAPAGSNATNSTFIGHAVANRSVSGSNNVALGAWAFNNGAGANNTIVGTSSVATPGEYQNIVALGSSVHMGGKAENVIAIGSEANVNGSEIKDAIAIGPESSVATNNSIAIGKKATTSDSGRIAIGNEANAVGEKSIAIGDNTLASSNANGVNNVAIGYHTLQNNNPSAANLGSYNVAIGTEALQANTIGSRNTVLGNQAAKFGVGANFQDNTIIGASAGGCVYDDGKYYNADSKMVAVGASSVVTSQGAIAIGYEAKVAGSISAPATDSIAIGNAAKVYGSNAMAIGAGVENARNNVIQLGNDGQTVYIPGNLVVGKSTVLGYNNNKRNLDGSNQALTYVRASGRNYEGQMLLYYGTLYRGNTLEAVAESGWRNYVEGVYPITQYNDIVSIFGGSYSSSSDRRLKYVGKENTSGLDKIRQLKVFNYTYKKDTTKTPHVGVIAQDLQKVFPNAVKKGTDGFLTIRMEDMFYALVNAVKELDAKITALQKENQELKATVKQIQDNNKQLEIRLNKLEAKVK